MYDTIKATLTKNEYPNHSFLENTPQFLDKIKDEGIKNGNKYVSGYVGNLLFYISDFSVSLNRGSLCKFQFGNNFKTLNRHETKIAIQKISDTLHLPFELANVSKIHFGHSINVVSPINNYLNNLWNCTYYNRLEQPHGIYYKNKLRELLFYDKVKEQTTKKENIPEMYKDKNVLRYELQYNHRVKKQLLRNDLQAKHLFDELLYQTLVNNWKNQYFSINKNGFNSNNMQSTGSKKELINNLALIGLLQLTPQRIDKEIKVWQQNKLITKKQAYDLRTGLKELQKNNTFEKNNSVINELDTKIKQIARYQ